MLILCQNVGKDLLILSDLILSTIIFSPFYRRTNYSLERLTYFSRLAMEFFVHVNLSSCYDEVYNSLFLLAIN